MTLKPFYQEYQPLSRLTHFDKTFEYNLTTTKRPHIFKNTWKQWKICVYQMDKTMLKAA